MDIQRKFVKTQERVGNWMETRHTIGKKSAWRDINKKNVYYTKDGRHGDIEVWKVSGKRAYHQGSLEPIEGSMYKKPTHAPELFE